MNVPTLSQTQALHQADVAWRHAVVRPLPPQFALVPLIQSGGRTSLDALPPTGADWLFDKELE